MYLELPKHKEVILVFVLRGPPTLSYQSRGEVDLEPWVLRSNDTYHWTRAVHSRSPPALVRPSGDIGGFYPETWPEESRGGTWVVGE